MRATKHLARLAAAALLATGIFAGAAVAPASATTGAGTQVQHLLKDTGWD